MISRRALPPLSTSATAPKNGWRVLAAMFVAMVCSAATLASRSVQPLASSQNALIGHSLRLSVHGHLHLRSFLLGLVFSIWAAAAGVVARRWHTVRLSWPAALRGAAYVSVGQPLILLGAALCGAAVGRVTRSGSWIAFALAHLGTAAASALTAYVVARAARFMTGRRKPLLTQAMVIWGVAWVGLRQMIERSEAAGLTLAGLLPATFPPNARLEDAFAIGPLLSWQVPIGMALAVWFVRTNSTSEYEVSDGRRARLWAKVAGVVATAVLLWWVGFAATEKAGVPVNETDVVPDPDEVILE